MLGDEHPTHGSVDSKRSSPMRRFRYALPAALVVALVAATAALAAPVKIVPFNAKYTGQASTKNESNVVTIAATGTGLASTIGAGKITGAGTGDSSQQPCVPFGGLGSMTGKYGTIKFKVLNATSQGCGDEGGHTFAIKGNATVLKATGRLALAKGTLKFTGIYDRDGGTFSVKFSGQLRK
jgi:hypothetical protein